jgi:hypothetical protein
LENDAAEAAAAGAGAEEVEVGPGEDEAEQDIYADIGRRAAEAGVIVNVISITDAQCSLENLGTVADLTGGAVTRINPMELVNNFKGILSQNAVATNVQVAMLLHSALQFRNESSPGASVVASASAGGADQNEQKEESSSCVRKTSRSVKDVGNAMNDTEIFFEYQVRSSDAAAVAKTAEAIPFQVQIYYTRLDGSKCVRVITQNKPVTADQNLAARQMDASIVAASSAQKCANMAQAGKYSKARSAMRANQQWFAQHTFNEQHAATSMAYARNMSEFDNMVHNLQAQESGDDDSASEEEEAGALSSVFSRRKVLSKKGKKMKKRSKQRSDAVSEKMYALKKMSPAALR